MGEPSAKRGTPGPSSSGVDVSELPPDGTSCAFAEAYNDDGGVSDEIFVVVLWCFGPTWCDQLRDEKMDKPFTKTHSLTQMS